MEASALDVLNGKPSQAEVGLVVIHFAAQKLEKVATRHAELARRIMAAERAAFSSMA